MQCITFTRIRFQAQEHKVVLGQGVLNVFQFCVLTARMFLDIVF